MGPPEVRGGARRALKSTLAWTAAATALVLVQYVVRGPDRFWWLVEAVSGNVAGVLSFAAVAGGVRLAEFQGRRLRAAAVAGVAVAVAAYVMAALVQPLAEYAGFSWEDRYGADIEMFGVQIPPGILRNLAYVLENPPAEYSMSVEHPDRAYPARLRPFPSPSCGHGGDRASQHLRGTAARSGDPWDAPARPPSNAVVRGSGRHGCRRRCHLAGARTEPGVGDRVRGRRGVGAGAGPGGPDRHPGSRGASSQQPCAPLHRAVSSGGWTTLSWNCFGPETRSSFAS